MISLQKLQCLFFRPEYRVLNIGIVATKSTGVCLNCAGSRPLPIWISQVPLHILFGENRSLFRGIISCLTGILDQQQKEYSHTETGKGKHVYFCQCWELQWLALSGQSSHLFAQKMNITLWTLCSHQTQRHRFFYRYWFASRTSTLFSAQLQCSK